MLIKVVKNFVDKRTVSELTQWTLSNYKDSKVFIDPYMGEPGTKFSNRFATPIKLKSGEVIKSDDSFTYPDIVYDVQEKLNKYLKLDASTYLAPIGKDGIVTDITLPGGTVSEHIDPVWVENYYTIHCNLVTQTPNGGGVTIIDGQSFNPEEGDVLIYAVSEHHHRVTKVEGDRLRVLWTFGFCVIPPITFEIFK
jgi:hypothetical protein